MAGVGWWFVSVALSELLSTRAAIRDGAVNLNDRAYSFRFCARRAGGGSKSSYTYIFCALYYAGRFTVYTLSSESVPVSSKRLRGQHSGMEGGGVWLTRL